MPVIFAKLEGAIESNNGDIRDDGRLELKDILVVETVEGQRFEFEVVGIVEDDEHAGFAVAYSEKADEFVVTDERGKLIEDDAVAQEVLEDFFELADESAEDT